MSERELTIIHGICSAIRGNTWAGIDEGKSSCRNCPQVIDTPHGKGTQGCFLLAMECYELAHSRFTVSMQTAL